MERTFTSPAVAMSPAYGVYAYGVIVEFITGPNTNIARYLELEETN
jgi:hypothetical protein